MGTSMHPRAGIKAALVTAAVGLLICTPATADAAEPEALGVPGDVVDMPLRSALQALDVQEEVRAGYERSRFRHWVDADKDGCNTRQEVLKEEASLAPDVGANCSISGGQWYSSYDDTYVRDAKGLDIDHLVPLAESWDSGASAWSGAERQAYANDLGDSRALLAVTAKTNRSKSDKDVAEWLPPFEATRCGYVADWIAVKTRWQLSVDPAEATALAEAADSCPNGPVRVTLAR